MHPLWHQARALAALAGTLGFATVWFAGPDQGGDPADPPAPVADPGTLAAALSASVPAAHLGVVAGPGDGRHPAVVAREVTALDHVSGGRAALRLRFGRDNAEAAAICRGLFTGDRTTVDGSTYSVSQAPNRPPPCQHGGPALVADVADPDEIDAALAAEVDAVCTAGDVAGAARRLAEVARAGQGTRPPALVWTGALPPGDGARGAVAGLRAAGADAVICRLPPGPAAAATVRAWADAVGAGGRT